MDSDDNFDSRFQAKLSAQTEELDRLMRKDDNLLNLIQGSFKSGLSQLMAIIYAVAIVLGAVILYSGYQYFGVNASDKLFWGMVLLLSFQAQIATKQWIWLEMNRASTIKEIKRLQLFIEHAGDVE
jgi:hypothetical protein